MSTTSKGIYKKQKDLRHSSVKTKMYVSPYLIGFITVYVFALMTFKFYYIFR